MASDCHGTCPPGTATRLRGKRSAIPTWGTLNDSKKQAANMFVATAVLIVLLLSGLRIAQEYQRGVILRLGRYVGLRGPGLYWIVPLGIERATTIDVRTLTVSAEQQETINRDSVTIK